MKPLFVYRSSTEHEVWKRIRVALCAYAYEIMDKPIITDHEFDELAASIDLSINTNRLDLDEWFRQEFQPHTGSWIHKHPELPYIRRIYERFC